MACAFDRCCLVGGARDGCVSGVRAENDLYGSLPAAWQRWTFSQAVALAGVRLAAGVDAASRPLCASDVMELEPVSKSVSAILPPVNAVLREGEALGTLDKPAALRSQMDVVIENLLAEFAFRRRQRRRHLQLVPLLEDTAAVYMLRTSTLASAVSVHMATIELVKAHHGEASAHYQRARRELALCYCFQGAYDSAAPILADLEATERTRSLDRARTLQYCGLLASATNKYGAAASALGEALAIAMECHDAAISTLASASLASGDLRTGGDSTLSRGASAARAAASQASEVRSEILSHIAQLTVKQDRLLEARGIAEAALNALRSDAVLCALPVHAVALHALAGVYKRLGLYTESAARYCECITQVRAGFLIARIEAHALR